MPSKPGTLKTGSYLPAREGSQVGAVRDESEHLREGKVDGEARKEMQEGSVDH